MKSKCYPSVLITSAGRRVELIQLWQKSLRKALGTKAKVFANDVRPDLSAACQVADQAFKICRCSDPGYPSQLLEQCIDKGVGLVIPTIDTELIALSEARDLFLENGVQLVVSDTSFVRQCRDKRLTARLFESLSVDTPKIYEPSAITFPCFMKPVSGSSSVGVGPVITSDQLSTFDRNNPLNLFQEIVDRDWIEYTVDLYYSAEGRLMSCVPRQRLEARGGEISKGITRRDGVWSFVSNYFEFLEGARGPITLQLFANPVRESFLGIEINPRFGGGYPMSHAVGVDYPDMLIREYLLGESIVKQNNWRHDVMMLRHDAMIVLETSIAELE